MSVNGQDGSAPAPLLSVIGFGTASMWRVTEDSDPDDPTSASPDGVALQMMLVDSDKEESVVSMYIHAENVSDIVQALVEGLRGQKDPGGETGWMGFDGKE